MLNCYLLDDEPLALELLEDDLRRIPGITIVGKSVNPLLALQEIATLKPDLLISDIQMPSLTGIELTRSLSYKPWIIFLTAYANFATEGYELDVVDFLLKPVAFNRLLVAVNKVIIRKQEREAAQLTKHWKDRDYFFVKADYQDLKVSFDSILYVEALKDYVKIFLRNNNKPVITKMSLKSIEALLPDERFFRIHRSYMVNVEKIESIKRNQLLINNQWIPLGEGYKDRIFQVLGIDAVQQEPTTQV